MGRGGEGGRHKFNKLTQINAPYVWADTGQRSKGFCTGIRRFVIVLSLRINADKFRTWLLVNFTKSTAIRNSTIIAFFHVIDLLIE